MPVLLLQTHVEREPARLVGASAECQRVNSTLVERQAGLVDLQLPGDLGQLVDADAARSVGFATDLVVSLPGLMAAPLAAQKIVAQRPAAAPGGMELRVGSVAVLEPGVPFLEDIVAVVVGQIGHLELQQAVLVVDLYDGHTRFLGVGGLRVAVHVLKKYPGVLWLHADHLVVDLVDGLAVVRHLLAVLGGRSNRPENPRPPSTPRDVQIDVGVDAMSLQHAAMK